MIFSFIKLIQPGKFWKCVLTQISKPSSLSHKNMKIQNKKVFRWMNHTNHKMVLFNPDNTRQCRVIDNTVSFWKPVRYTHRVTYNRMLLCDHLVFGNLVCENLTVYHNETMSLLVLSGLGSAVKHWSHTWWYTINIYLYLKDKLCIRGT